MNAIEKAKEFATKAHKGQYRKGTRNCEECKGKKLIHISEKEITGCLHCDDKGQVKIPYVEHPIAVSQIACKYVNKLVHHLPNDFSMGWTEELVVTALLHDVVEDTDITFDEIEKEFGTRVKMNLVYLTHEPEITYSYYIINIVQSDKRIPILVKLSDIVHNLSTAEGHLSKHKIECYKLAKFLLEKTVDNWCLNVK